MTPLGLTQYRVAKDIGVPALRISQIVRRQRSITADSALRLARYFGTSPDVWLRLQAGYDLEVAQRQIEKRIEREVKALPPAAIDKKWQHSPPPRPYSGRWVIKGYPLEQPRGRQGISRVLRI